MLDKDEMREIRIMALAERYAKGFISLREFFESELKENDDIREQERQKLKEILEESHKERLIREGLVPDRDPSEFHITKEGYYKLNLREQSQMYEDHPKEIRKLIGREIGSKMTKKEFEILTSKEQEKVFKEKRDDVLALLGGKVDSVDVGDLV